MKESTKFNLVWLLFLSIMVVIIGAMFNLALKLDGWTKAKNAEVKQIYIGDQLKKCEDAGGKYSLFYSEYQPSGYYQTCKTLEKKIELN